MINMLARKMSDKNVPPFFEIQPGKLDQFLPYESVESKNRPLFILSDTSLGVMWELSTLAHEAMELSEMAKRLESLSRIFLLNSDSKVYLQLIYDSEPCSEISKPSWFEQPTTIEQQIVKNRIIMLEQQEVHSALPLMSRSLHLSLRVVSKKEIETRDTDVDAEIQIQHQQLSKLEAEIDILATEIEMQLMRAGFSFKALDAESFVKVTKPVFHSIDALKSSQFFRKVHTKGRLSSALVDDFVTFAPNEISVQGDTWQVLSLSELPQEAFDGIGTKFLQVKQPIRIVINLRTLEKSGELSKKEYFLRNARDATSVRQQRDVKAALESIAYGDKFLGMSFHVLVRHVGTVEKSSNRFESMRRQLENTVGLPFITESRAAPLTFWSCLPFGFNEAMVFLIARERPVQVSRVGSLLALYGGFKGTNDKIKGQILQSRSGEAMFLSPRASETSSHAVTLSTSGGGKSFLCANILTAERAFRPTSCTFILDKKTSYEILATVFGQRNGFVIAKPPESFPNLFKGELDDEGERLRSIVNVLKTAISLSSNGEAVDAVKTNILAVAIQKTFEDANLDSQTAFDAETRLLSTQMSAERTVPRLSEIVDNLVTVCERGGFNIADAKWLRDKLSPFYGNGPYAIVFDKVETVSFENPTPSISLFDLDGVAGDKILSVLTTLIIISDIIRQIKRKENRGRGFQLVIDEAGMLAGESKEISEFIDDAWKTFRKLDCMGLGLTNQVSDFKFKAGPKTMWAVSPNKYILRMPQSEIDDAFKETSEAPALLKGELKKNLIESLVKKDGEFSQGLFVSQETCGTFHYKPSGFDYWLAASRPIEVSAVHDLAKKLGAGEKGYMRALSYLAIHHAGGIREKETGQLRGLTTEEIEHIANNLKKEFDDE